MLAPERHSYTLPSNPQLGWQEKDANIRLVLLIDQTLLSYPKTLRMLLKLKLFRFSAQVNFDYLIKNVPSLRPLEMPTPHS